MAKIIQVPMTEEEYAKLRAMADAERRTAPKQILHWIESFYSQFQTKAS